MDRRFAEIVFGLEDELEATTATTELDAATARPQDPIGSIEAAPDSWVPRDPPPLDQLDERARRKELRRLEREAEFELFQQEKERLDAEREADQEHFVPPEPPPIPRPGRRTLAGLLLLVLGLVVLIRPGLLQVAGNVALALGLLSCLGGAGLLFANLRRRPASPEDGEGWDDGARL